MLHRYLSTVIMNKYFISKCSRLKVIFKSLSITHTLIELSPGATCNKPFVIIVPRATRETILCRMRHATFQFSSLMKEIQLRQYRLNISKTYKKLNIKSKNVTVKYKFNLWIDTLLLQHICIHQYFLKSQSIYSRLFLLIPSDSR